MHYERSLDEAVRFYRSPPAGSRRSRVLIGEAFMTTHSFAVDRLAGDYKTRVREYQERNATLLAICRAAVSRGGDNTCRPERMYIRSPLRVSTFSGCIFALFPTVCSCYVRAMFLFSV